MRKLATIKRKQPVEVDESSCEHFWMIESPNGPTSTGICQVCGESREFVNYLERSAWSSAGLSLQQHSEAERERQSLAAAEGRRTRPTGRRAAGGGRGV